MPSHDSTPGSDPRDDALAERGRALVAHAVGDTRAPHGLRERIEADRARAATSARRRGRVRLLGGLAAGVAAAALAVVIATGGSEAPTVLATARLAAQGPALAAPQEDPENPALLRAEIDGVAFPAWDDAFRWRAVGARADEIEGRDTETVFYDTPKGVRAAYTIVAGEALEQPAGARVATLKGVDLWIVRQGGRTIVSWERAGHTCVMTAPSTVSEDKLLALAAWKAKGAVEF